MIAIDIDVTDSYQAVMNRLGVFKEKEAATVVSKALNRTAKDAKKKDLTTIKKCLIDGIDFIASKYIGAGQDTLYLEKFDVIINGGCYQHQYAQDVMKDDLFRMDHFPHAMYNFHPGSHVKQGVDVGIELISQHLNNILHKDLKTKVLLETMAGKGSEVGRTFEELRAIIDRVELSEQVGVCLDTCHVFDGGYDIVNHLDDVLESFDKVIGLKRLRAIHLNDSKNPMGSHKDRHEVIGGGNIGLEALVNVVNHPALKGLPFYLETPNELPGYAAEIALMRSRER